MRSILDDHQRDVIRIGIVIQQLSRNFCRRPRFKSKLGGDFTFTLRVAKDVPASQNKAFAFVCVNHGSGCI